jgi:pimeloyl-ACP methyl ester carboxylesterase
MGRNLLIVFNCLVLSLLLISNCTNEPGNIAISSDQVKINFAVRGKGSPALVFVHGWSNNRNTWDDQVSYFSQKYKVVTIDLAGFGGSGNDREKWNMASFGKDIVAVINKLKLDHVVLIAHSMGGAVIIETSKMIPKQISGLVLVDVFHNVERKYTEQFINNWDSMAMDLVSAPTFEKVKPDFKNNSEVLSKRYITMVENVPKIGWSESIKDYYRWRNEECIESLKMINAPIILINSDQDSTSVKGFRKYHSSFEIKIIPGVYHYVHWEAPAKFNLLLEESIQEFMNQHQNSYGAGGATILKCKPL